MALYIVRHEHEPERCPAIDPYAGAELLNYLSRPNVARHGRTQPEQPDWNRLGYGNDAIQVTRVRVR
jgi:hypothetical protein